MERLIQLQVRTALEEDAVSQDHSSHLLDQAQQAHAELICRECAVFCGTAWAESVYQILDRDRNTHTKLSWHTKDGDAVDAGDTVLTLHGNAATVLSGERVALNFLQMLSGIATQCRAYRHMLDGSAAHLFATRKTLPGLRLAQKYAVRIGGGHNHRNSLSDAILLKENHLHAFGNNIPLAVSKARAQHPDMQLIVEVENLEQLQILLRTDADVALLDNFSIQDMRQAVRMTKGKLLLEASGNIDIDNIRKVANTGVNRISVGALTKNVRAIDFSMRFRSQRDIKNPATTGQNHSTD